MNDENNNPLDLNNLPDDFTARDNERQTQFEAGSSSSGQTSSRKKKTKDDEIGKVYECRFCSLKFCKSQALGGHMNRHRQERETEQLNKARMLVFSNESNISTVHGLPAHHLGGQPVGPNGSGFHQQVIDPTLHFRAAYPVQPMRLPSSLQSSTISQHQHINPPHPYLYPSPSRTHFVPSYHPSLYHPSNDSIDHALGTSSPDATNYTCIGTPVGPTGFISRISNSGVRENVISSSSMHTSATNGLRPNSYQEDGLNWDMRGFGRIKQHQQPQPAAITRLDLSSSSFQFQDGI